MRTNRAVPLGLLVCLTLAPLASPGRAGGSPERPADLPKQQESNFKTWATRCSQCHDPERAYSQKYVQEPQIRALVTRMAHKPGAAISPSDQKRIVAYLVWYHSRTSSGSN